MSETGAKSSPEDSTSGPGSPPGGGVSGGTGDGSAMPPVNRMPATPMHAVSRKPGTPASDRRTVGLVGSFAVADFLLPEGFTAPRLGEVLREASVVTEVGRLAVRELGHRFAGPPRGYAGGAARRDVDPVVLVPGFMAGDASLSVLAAALRAQGHRTYRSHIHANIGCTLAAAAQLETRLETVAQR